MRFLVAALVAAYLSVSTVVSLQEIELKTMATADAKFALPRQFESQLWSSGVSLDGTIQYYVGPAEEGANTSTVCPVGVTTQVAIVQVRTNGNATVATTRHVCGLPVPNNWGLQFVKYLPESDAVVIAFSFNNVVLGEMDGGVVVYSASNGTLLWSRNGGFVPVAAVDGAVVVSNFLASMWVAAFDATKGSAAPLRWNTTAPPNIAFVVDKIAQTGKGLVVVMGQVLNFTKPSHPHKKNGDGSGNVYMFSINSTSGALMCSFNATNYLNDPLKVVGTMALRKPFNSFHYELWDMSSRCRVVATCFGGDSDSLIAVGDSWYHMQTSNGTLSRFGDHGGVLWTTSLNIEIETGYLGVPQLGEDVLTGRLQYFASFVLYEFLKSDGSLMRNTSYPPHWQNAKTPQMAGILPYAPLDLPSPRQIAFSLGSRSCSTGSCNVLVFMNLQGFTAFIQEPTGSLGPQADALFHLKPLGWNVHTPLVVVGASQGSVTHVDAKGALVVAGDISFP